MEKPNFERITKALSQQNIHIRRELSDEEIIRDWGKLFQDEIYFPYRLSIEVLLNEFEMNVFFSDFMLIGLIFVENSKKCSEPRPQSSINQETELLEALKVLLSNKNGFSIEIYRRQIHQVSLQDAFWIDMFKNSLFDYLKRRYNHNYESSYLDIEKDWGKYIKNRLIELKNEAPKKGRPIPIKQKYVKSMAFCLWRYLEANTNLKADNGALYSRKQARFIFRFLEIHEIINQDFSNKEDVIGYYITSCYKAQQERIRKNIDTREERLDYFRVQKMEKEGFLNKNHSTISDSWKKSLEKDIKFYNDVLEHHKLHQNSTK